jgi:hypothetical protein
MKNLIRRIGRIERIGRIGRIERTGPTAPRPRVALADRACWTWASARFAIGASVVALTLIDAAAGIALETPIYLDRFEGEDAKTIEEIATYPAKARQAALVAAGHPEQLLEIQKIQQRSADDFAALIASYPRETQQQIWSLVRHPQLASDLAAGGRKTPAQLEAIAQRYPEADRAAILEEGRERHEVWTSIYALDLEVEQAVFVALADQPAPVREAFDELTRQPGLTSLLIDDIQTTTLLGALYREDPAGVEASLGTIHDQMAARRAEEERAWAAEVADPESAAELEHAARLFAEENDVDWEEVRSEPATNVQITYQVNVQPYPYWYGYPYWYPVAYWYPRPIWGHVGFYYYGFGYGFGSGYVSVGLPSPYFLGWYHTTYVPRYQVAYRKSYSGDKPYHHVHYYDTHRPHSSAGQRRHHDLTARRAHLDSGRHRTGSLADTSPQTRAHRGSRSYAATRAPAEAPSRRSGPTARRTSFDRRSSAEVSPNPRRSSRPADRTRTAARTRESNPPAVSAPPPSRRESDRSADRRQPQSRYTQSRPAKIRRIQNERTQTVAPTPTQNDAPSRRTSDPRVRREDASQRARIAMPDARRERTLQGPRNEGPSARSARFTERSGDRSTTRSTKQSTTRSSERANARATTRSSERREARPDRTRESRTRVERKALRQSSHRTSGLTRGQARGQSLGQAKGRPATRGGGNASAPRGQGRNQRSR